MEEPGVSDEPHSVKEGYLDLHQLDGATENNANVFTERIVAKYLECLLGMMIGISAEPEKKEVEVAQNADYCPFVYGRNGNA